ncbi:MAG TPA: alpha-amylase family glycosyl hydrolase [Bacteroidales bacterium]|nr:alpha-amylase family glycosyl hydrolase [Bacteroidales bacterium]
MKTTFHLFSVIFLLTLLFTSASAQVIVTVPVYPTDLDSCTVIFDATKGNAGLKDVPPPIYAHTGVITDSSTSSSGWRYVLAPWNQNIPKALMTPLGNNLYSIRLVPSIREFYGVPATEKILKIAFVFRNADGSKAGREADGGDIFGNVYPAVTSVTITAPAVKALYLPLNDSIPVSATSPLADTMFLYVNQTLIKKNAGHVITDTLLAYNFGQYWTRQWVTIRAVNDTASAADSFFYSVVPPPPVAALPPGMKDGINYIDSTTVLLSLFAPYKDFCFVTGDFTGWQTDSAFYMNRTPDGTRYWLQVSNLIPNKEYIFQYLVDGTLLIADPYCDKVSDPDDQYIDNATYPDLIPYPTGKTTQIASVLQTAQAPYAWNHPSITEPALSSLVIYELLIRDFTVQHDYPSLIDTLHYLKRLGVNAIELMPVMEFEGNSSWGYNPDFEFAPDKYYGTREGLKEFIDTAHGMGIAVILDIVLNHQFGQSPLARLYWDDANQRPAANSPWFNPIPTHPANVGNDFNHQSPYTREFCTRVLRYWVTEYHADGYRLDLSKGFTQVNSYPGNWALWAQKDTARIRVLENYYDSVRTVKPDVLFILEHFADNDEETELSAYGMLLWGNSNSNYSDATEGWVTGNLSDFSGISYKNRGWSEPHLVGYMESHDEERVMYNNITFGNQSNPAYPCRDTNFALNRMGMAATFFYTIPGPKMLWQFGELGYDYSINYPTGTSDSRLDPKPIRWDYYGQFPRRYLYNVCSALIGLKNDQPVFSTSDFTLNVGGALKGITLRGSDMDAEIIGNFNVWAGNIVPGFTRTGMWYDYFTGDSLDVSSVSDPVSLEPGEYHLYTTKRLVKPIFTGIGGTVSPASGPGFLTIYPNPSSKVTRILYSIGEPARVKISICDLSGREIAVLTDGLQTAGTHEISWDHTNLTGQTVAPGIYFCSFLSAGHREIRKIIVSTE